MLSLYYREADPPRGQNTSKLAMGEERRVAVQRGKTGDEPVGPGGDLLRRFTARTAVRENIPARPRLADVRRAQSLIVAIVPFREIRFNLRRRAQTSQLTGPPRALQRAGQHTRKLKQPQGRSGRARLLLAMRGQRNVGAAGVLARQGPCGLAIANEVQPGQSHGVSIALVYSPRRAA